MNFSKQVENNFNEIVMKKNKEDREGNYYKLLKLIFIQLFIFELIY